jgi:hypothetical protein
LIGPAACRATVAGLHMRTWLHALPRRHRAEAASLGRVRRGRPDAKKRVRVPVSLRNPYALATKAGCRERLSVRQTAGALARRGLEGKVAAERYGGEL